MNKVSALALALVVLLPIQGHAKNLIRVSAPIAQAVGTPGSGVTSGESGTPDPEPEEDPVEGSKPSMDSLQVLFRFNGNTTQEGAWGTRLSQKMAA